MIPLEALQLRRLAIGILRQLHVTETVAVMDVRELTDGAWAVGFEDHFADSRFPGFEIIIQQDWSDDRALRELRVELREKLWICPLCQRRSRIRRIVDRAVFRVECDVCGRYEIEHALLDRFRLAYDTEDTGLVEKLPRLSDFVRQADSTPLLSAHNWLARADPQGR